MALTAVGHIITARFRVEHTDSRAIFPVGLGVGPHGGPGRADEQILDTRPVEGPAEQPLPLDGASAI